LIVLNENKYILEDITTMKDMTKEQHERFKKAVKDGLLTQKQHDKLSPGLLEGILKSKMKGGASKKKKKKSKKGKK